MNKLETPISLEEIADLHTAVATQAATIETLKKERSRHFKRAVQNGRLANSLKQDAGRYRWIALHCLLTYRSADLEIGYLDIKTDPEHRNDGWLLLDDAIDAAIADKQP